ncbi:MAG: 2-C-methyl-D-erythritol 2,4-cyclodiphosphate synthase, partial [Sphaerochaetaceae bacterium]|nr:2-C-methyl-D-erythritol 2,4-cyclodiphosphate synthase [Sphaerochaetaceae bacterium]
ALSLGDIGDHFPDTESKYKDISSLVLLEEVMSLVRKEGYEVVNLDTVIVLQSPKLGPYKEKIREQIAKTMALDVSQVSIKAKTAEHMLMELGESNAILSGSVVLLEKTKA